MSILLESKDDNINISKVIIMILWKLIIIILEIQKLAKLLRYILINKDTQKMMISSKLHDK